jgi:hypothetical protein
MPIKKNRCLAILFIICLSLIVFLTRYLFFTPRGSLFVVKSALSGFIQPEDVDIKTVEGSLSNTLSLQDLEIGDLEGLPEGSVVKIQKLQAYLISFSPAGLNIDVQNGKLLIPRWEPVFFYGGYHNASLAFDVYAKYLSVRDILDLFTQAASLKNLSGRISEADVFVKGSFREPLLSGRFHIEELSRGGFAMKDCRGDFELRLRDIKDNLKLYGEVSLKKAVLSGENTAVIILRQGKILFDGDAKNPSFNLEAASDVEGTRINVVLRGNASNPDLRLSSEPMLPQERLLIMLATGKSWSGAETSLSKGQVSVDLAKDFIDYFVFSGTGSKIAQQLGLSAISVKYDGKAKGIGVKKDILGRAEASYSIEQAQGEAKSPQTAQKMGGEYKITENISLEAQKELKQESSANQTQDSQKPDDKIMLKFKREF